MKYLLFYLLLINILSLILFAIDKNAAKHNKTRIPEKTLHLLELLGGVFSILPFMYVIHHKSSKFSYYILTFLIFVGWILLLYMVIFKWKIIH